MSYTRKPMKTLLALAASSCVLSACATTGPGKGAAQFSLGDNASGDPCTAVQNWTDPSYGESAVKFGDTYSINCRGATTGALGRVRVFDSEAARTSFAELLSCANPISVELSGFKNSTARRCVDPGLGYSAVVIDAERGGLFFQSSSAANAVGAAYQATRILAKLDSSNSASSTLQPFEVARLAATENLSAAPQVTGGDETLNSILAQGTALNFRGLHSDASRYINAAINSLGDNARPRDLAELKMEAGLADSNIKFFGSADKQFAEASALIETLETADQLALRPKLRNYQGLHALNQRDFSKARRLLSTLVNGDSQSSASVADAATFIRLNRSNPDDQDVRSSISLPDEAIMRDAFLYTQAAWALSVAEISLGNSAGATTALDNAQSRFDLLKEMMRSARIREDGIYWMAAQLDRQRGRTEASRGNYDRSLDLFDSSIDSLVRGSIAKLGTGTEPAIAELKLERAALTARAGRSQDAVDMAYEEAVDALVLTRGENTTFRTAVLKPYLDRLVEQVANGDREAQERYFMAMQVTGETGAAKQISQLQSIVSTDSATGGLLRDVEELESQIAGLDLKISEARSAGSDASKLEEERAEVQQKYFELDAQIESDSRLSSISSRPATIADVQASMETGEAYAKFSLIGEDIFGILIQKNSAKAIRPTQSAQDVLIFKDKLRASIDGQIDAGELPEFSVASAVVLYQILFGDVDDILTDRNNRVTELIVDGGEVLNGISPAVLVTDDKAAVKFARQYDKFDYTDIDFLAKLVPTTIAISPRSFIASRAISPSEASEPLIGFASPEPMSSVSLMREAVQVGPCVLTPAQISGLSRRFAPIPVDEINIAAKALGLSGPSKTVSGQSFTDTELLRTGGSGGDLSRYQVVHFATHGLTEGQFGCAEAPAALLTSFGDAGSDMLLSFDEIARLRLDANLVVLSACETASEVGERALRLSGEVLPGATLEGLVRAFFSANARSVMATYWESSNSGESEMFMESFYSNGRSQPISEALNSAQNTLMTLENTSHPFYWGGFFVVGNTNNTMLSGGSMPVASIMTPKKKS